MGTASQTLAEFVAGVRYDDLPATVVGATTRHCIDTVGVALAAADAGVATPLVDMVRSWAGAREASVLGHDFAAPTAAAALVNATLAHGMDFDDTHLESVVHPSAVVIATAFAVGEEIGADGRDVLTAAVAGYEVATRIGAAAPGRFQVRGQSATAICGAFGAAAVAARLWGLSADETTHAFGIAGTQAGGLHGTGAPEGLHAGWAAHAGIIAADLARRGSTGPATLFEGPHGLFDSLLAGEEPDRARLVRDLGSSWETLRLAIRPYPASDFVQAFVDAAAHASVKWADVEEIICFVAPAIVDVVAEPRTLRLHPVDAASARRSLPFAVASAIVGGRDAMDLFGDEARADRRILTLAERVHHEPDPALPFPETYGGRLRINTRGGRTIDIDEIVNRGHPERPLTDAELTEKFLQNARGRMDLKGAKRLLTRLQRLADAPDIEHVTETLRVV